MNEESQPDPHAPQPQDSASVMHEMREEMRAPPKTRGIIIAVTLAGVLLVGSCAVLGPLFFPAPQSDTIARDGQTASGAAPVAPLPGLGAPEASAPSAPAPAPAPAPVIAPVVDFQ